jgi:hypothetical protein
MIQTELIHLDPAGAASETEFEITTETIEAGIDALRPLEYNLWEARDPQQLQRLVSAIYRAMRAGSQHGRVDPV